MEPAKRSDWKILPEPDSKEVLGFDAAFTPREGERLREGLVPRAMEDKWFVFLEGDWLYFHRSWSGAAIYGLRLEFHANEVRVVDSWVNRDSGQYRNTDTAYDRELLRFIIDALLLGKAAEFPLPGGSEKFADGVVQHHYVGRAYPEKKR